MSSGPWAACCSWTHRARILAGCEGGALSVDQTVAMVGNSQDGSSGDFGTLNTCIVAGDRQFDIGWRVVLWNEPKGLNGYDESSKSFVASDRRTGKERTQVISGKRYTPRSAADSAVAVAAAAPSPPAPRNS